MTAAVQPGVEGPKAFKQRYQALLTHYGLQAQAIQAGKGNENGDVEQSHRQFKRALDQALMLRGSRDFVSREAYEAFLRQMFEQCNAGRRARLAEELPLLRALPARRLEACKRDKVRVDSSSTIRVEGNVYSVNIRDAYQGIVMDPDEQVQQAVRSVFELFVELGTVNAVVRYLRKNDIRLGIRPHSGPKRGQLQWREACRNTVRNLVRHPIYAGAYAYGRFQVDPRAS